MDLQVIKNPDARAFINLVNKVRKDWEERKKGRELSGVIMTVAKAYPEDTHAIVELFHKKRERAPQKQSIDATPPAQGAGSVDVANCPSCPETVNNAVGAGRGSTVAEPETTHLQTKEGVLKAFDNDADTLAIVAKGLGLNVGNSGKAGTIAGKIAYHYRVKAGVQ